MVQFWIVYNICSQATGKLDANKLEGALLQAYIGDGGLRKIPFFNGWAIKVPSAPPPFLLVKKMRLCNGKIPKKDFVTRGGNFYLGGNLSEVALERLTPAL